MKVAGPGLPFTTRIHLRFIRKDDAAAARRVRMTVATSIAKLSSMEERGRKVKFPEPESSSFILALHRRLRIMRDEVVILRIRHASQLWPYEYRAKRLAEQLLLAPFHRQRHRVPPPDTAQPRLLRIASHHLVEQRHQHARTARSDRMPDRHRTTVTFTRSRPSPTRA